MSAWKTAAEKFVRACRPAMRWVQMRRIGDMPPGEIGCTNYSGVPTPLRVC